MLHFVWSCITQHSFHKLIVYFISAVNLHACLYQMGLWNMTIKVFWEMYIPEIDRGGQPYSVIFLGALDNQHDLLCVMFYMYRPSSQQPYLLVDQFYFTNWRHGQLMVLNCGSI